MLERKEMLWTMKKQHNIESLFFKIKSFVEEMGFKCLKHKEHAQKTTWTFPYYFQI